MRQPLRRRRRQDQALLPSLSDPYFLGSEFSFRTPSSSPTSSSNFQQDQHGVELGARSCAHRGQRTRGFLRYSYTRRRSAGRRACNAAALIFREILHGNREHQPDRHLLQLGHPRRSLRADEGAEPRPHVEYAGLGGFSNFLRFEGRGAWYLGAPRWLLERSTFVVSSRIGYALPFNQISDFDLPGRRRDPRIRPTAGTSGRSIRSTPTSAAPHRALLPRRPRKLPAARLQGALRRAAPRDPAAQRETPDRQEDAFPPGGNRGSTTADGRWTVSTE